MIIAKWNDTQTLSLEQHHKDTEEVMQYLLEKFAPRELANKYSAECLFLSRVHDIGKATKEFQDYARGIGCQAGQRIHHTTSGYYILKEFGVSKDLCEIVAMHHGEAKAEFSGRITLHMDSLRPYVYGQEKDFEGYKRVWQEIIKDQPPKQAIQSQDKLSIAGLLSLADWIASNTDYFPYDVQPTRYEDYKEKLNLPDWWQVNQHTFSQLFNFEAYPIQQEVINLAKGIEKPSLFIYESETGCGKTEIALAIAEDFAKKTQAKGVYYAMPTINTANNMWNRFMTWAKTESDTGWQGIQLAHSKRKYKQEYQNLNCETLKKQFLFNRNHLQFGSTFGIGTIDHILKLGHRHKYVSLEHNLIRDKVVIIDEVHSYDPYMQTYLKKALQWLGYYHVPVIMLSATLPVHLKQDLIEAYSQQKIEDTVNLSAGYPICTYLDDAGKCRVYTPATPVDHREVKIKFRKNLKSIDDIVEETLAHGGCAGIMVNTIAMAQQLYDKYSSQYDVILLHSAFTDKDRADIEKKIEVTFGKDSTPEQRAGKLLIGTSVLEQSLDIDVDVLITEIAPMDCLIQRIGRDQRHANRPRPLSCHERVCYVINEIRIETTYVYNEELQKKTRSMLRAHPVIRVPEDIPVLVNTCYSNLTDYEMVKLSMEQQADSFLLRNKRNLLTMITRTDKDLSDDEGVRLGQSLEVYLEDEGMLRLPHKYLNELLKDVILYKKDELILYKDINSCYNVGKYKCKYTKQKGFFSE